MIRLKKIITKGEEEPRFLFCKKGVYFSLTKEEIKFVVELFLMINDDYEESLEEIYKDWKKLPKTNLSCKLKDKLDRLLL